MPLQPANKNYNPIIIKNGDKEIAIQGILIDIIKETFTPEKQLINKIKPKERKNKGHSSADE